MAPFRYHAFVCTQEKPENVPCCSAAGSFRILDALHRELGAAGLANDVQVSTCSCLGLCDSGPVMIVYPEGTWYAKLTPADVTEIVSSHFKQGKKVARLERCDYDAMKAEILDHREKYLAMVKAKDAAGVMPDDVVEMIRGFMPSRAVLTALEADIFTAVGDGGSAEQVAAKAGCNPRATKMLLNALVALKLLSKQGDRYTNSPSLSPILCRGHAGQCSPGATAYRKHVEAVVDADGCGESRNQRCAAGQQWLGEAVHRCHGRECARQGARCGSSCAGEWRQAPARSRRRLGRILDRIRQSGPRFACRNRRPRGCSAHHAGAHPESRTRRSHYDPRRRHAYACRSRRASTTWCCSRPSATCSRRRRIASCCSAPTVRSRQRPRSHLRFRAGGGQNGTALRCAVCPEYAGWHARGLQLQRAGIYGLAERGRLRGNKARPPARSCEPDDRHEVAQTTMMGRWRFLCPPAPSNSRAVS